ncbi:MAG: hypothetical protein HY473_01445 [Candidatus Sungbacteria bacterium]|uniref:Thrombospondin type 3 repeat superfamily protein n=1 Tax=Candidatus Sungiibacteriota bacterium TaxID=2750080 RepID=A0A933DTJ9_9BACT|nr:hypothetical protein [Candidatus Sungbacteria bacterium]
MGILAHGVFSLKRKARLLVAVLVFAAIGGASVWFAGYKPLAEKDAQNERRAGLDSTAAAAAVGEAAKDSDGDGLKDWEEALYGTALENPDSDGDGTPDGKEIAEGRDPLKPGPNDKINRPVAEESAQGRSGTAANDNLTQNLAKNLLESGILNAVDQEGRLSSTEFLDKLSLPKNVDPEELLKPAVTITTKDLRVNQNNDSGTIKDYFESISEIYARRIALHQARSDLVILTEVLESNDFAKLVELDPLITTLDLAVADIKNTPVPSKYVSFAVRELNYLLQTKRAIEIFRNTQNDPLATVLAIRGRFDLLLKIASFHAEVINDLYASGIRFNPG